MDDNKKRVSLDLPVELVVIIDQICKDNFITRRKWFIDAAKEKLEKENNDKIDRIVRG